MGGQDPPPVVVTVKKTKAKAPRKTKAKPVKVPEGAVISELVEDPEPLEPVNKSPPKPKPKRIVKKPKKKPPTPPPSSSSESSYSSDDESSDYKYSDDEAQHSPFNSPQSAPSPPPVATGPVRIGYRMRTPF